MRACPHCHSPHLHEYSSLRQKQCSECLRWLPWELKEDQAPLVANNRKKVSKKATKSC